MENSIFLDHCPLLVHFNNLTVLERAGGEINSEKPILAVFILSFSLSYNLEISSAPLTALSQVIGM